jgi:hypothetical protein
MVFFSAALALLGCVEPPVVDPVTDQLAAMVLDAAEPDFRLLISVSGVIAETCAVGRMSEYTFRGEAAAALGVTRPTVSESASGQKTWAFPDVGLDGVVGNLVLTTDSERSTFSTTYSVDSATVMTGAFHLMGCNVASDSGGDSAAVESADATAIVSGNIDVSSGAATHHLYIDGPRPESATIWSPPTGLAPAAGWAHWSDNEQRPTEEVTLEDASQIDYPTRSWPAKATGTGWERSVEVSLP